MSVNKKLKTIRFVGGGTVGFSKASFPFAILFANFDKITLHFGWNTYRFLPHQVVVLHGDKNGVQIKHTVKSYPAKIFFKGLESTTKTLRQIQQTGFAPCGDMAEMAIAKGNPFRKFATILPI